METRQNTTESLTTDTSYNQLKVFPLGLQFSSMVVLLLVCMILGSLLAIGVGSAMNVDLAHLAATADTEAMISKRGIIRVLLLISNASTFLLPGILFSVLLYRHQWKASVSAHKYPNGAMMAVSGLIMVLSLPAVTYSYLLNHAFPVPEWLAGSGQASMELVSAVMVMESPWELIMNLFVVALIPALGEEWIFRGFLQKRLGSFFSNPHLAIWIAAIIFSAFHGQFQLFLPRMLLGALLGYMFWWSGSIWLSVFAHFINNAVQVVAYFFNAEQMQDIDMSAPPEVVWWQALFSVVIVSLLLWVLYRWCKKENDIDNVSI